MVEVGSRASPGQSSPPAARPRLERAANGGSLGFAPGRDPAASPERAHRIPAKRCFRTHRRGQFLIASGVLWPDQTDVDANRVEAGADTVIDAKESAQINIPVDADLDLVELDAELRRPDPISYRLTDSPLEEAGFEPSVPATHF